MGQARERLSDAVAAERVIPLQRPVDAQLFGDLRHQFLDGGGFDVILNDVDNGPGGCALEQNEKLYTAVGLAAIRRSLRPKGVLGVWCVEDDPRFVKALSSAGFRAHAETVYARNVSKGHRHTVFIGQRS